MVIFYLKMDIKNQFENNIRSIIYSYIAINLTKSYESAMTLLAIYLFYICFEKKIKRVINTIKIKFDNKKQYEMIYKNSLNCGRVVTYLLMNHKNLIKHYSEISYMDINIDGRVEIDFFDNFIIFNDNKIDIKISNSDNNKKMILSADTYEIIDNFLKYLWNKMNCVKIMNIKKKIMGYTSGYNDVDLKWILYYDEFDSYYVENTFYTDDINENFFEDMKNFINNNNERCNKKKKLFIAW